MAELRLRTPLGLLAVVARDDEEARAAADLATGAAAGSSFGCGPVLVCGERAYFKRSALAGRASLRHALKRLLLRPLPRVAEYRNLAWLRARLFQAPEPLAAGFLVRFGLPRFQFLVTREVPDAVTLEEFLAGGARAEREPVLEELARETARMHAIHFVHHDLYPRNILVAGPDEPSRLWLLDCWAGGPSPQLRGPAYDLACLMLRAPETLAPEEQRRFFEIYSEERGAQGRPVDLDRLVDDTRRERRRLARRLALRPSELRGLPPPLLEWWDPI